MEDLNRLELVKNEVNKILMNQSDLDLRNKGCIHLKEVAQYCSLLALRRKMDVEICTIIGLMHDMYTFKYGYAKEHARLGAVEVEELLKKMEVFTVDEIEIIKNAINYHSNKKIKHDNYSELIKDADVLQSSIYNNNFEPKHQKRLKKVLRSLGIKLKSKKIRKIKLLQENDVL